MTSRPNPISPTQAQEQRLLEAALALGTEAERRAFLAAIGDPVARQRLEGLVAVSAEADSFFGAPPIQNAGVEFVEPTAPLTPPAEAPAQMLGRYKLLEKIGEGGFGEVWMAEQREPVKRRVALKVIKLGMDSRQIVARFEAERQALAMMEHANIARIFDADVTETGRPYFAMELVRGTRITDYCDQNQLTTKQRLGLFIKVCHAIQHAHQKGIIHRDIKPSNILVTVNDGAPVPKVIDFGIAKAMQGELTGKTVFTQFQQFIGTPAYISPEQAEMSSLDIDTRADIYSLGVLLYELLVGQTPFDAKEMMQGGIDALRKIIREKAPLRPSTKLNTLPGDARTTAGRRRQTDAGKLVHQLQGDLDWIVLKCLEKDRARRYETANGLAMDIQRHLANEPVVARPPSTAYKIQKACQRNKLAFTAAAAVAFALVVGISVSTWQLLRAIRAEREQSQLREQAETERRKAQEAGASEAKHRQAAEQARQQAQAQESVARRTAYNSDLNLAQQALQMNNLGRASEILNRHRPKPGESDLRGWEWRYLWRFCRSDALFTLCRKSNRIYSVSFSPNGKLLAVADSSSEVSIWDLDSRKSIMGRRTDANRQRIAFSPVTSHLAISEKGSDGQYKVTLWDTEKGEDLKQWSISQEARELVFARDGKSLAALSRSEWDGRIWLWDIASGRLLFEAPAARDSRGMGNVLAVSDRAETIAHGSQGGTVTLIEVATGREKSKLRATDERTMAVAILNDGKMLASAAGFTDPVVKLWNIATGEEVAHLEGHRGYVNALATSPDGRLLASASGDQTIRIWDWRERQSIRTLRGHSSEVLDVAFSPDGRTLASGCKDGTVCLWNITTNRQERAYDLLPVTPNAWSFAPDSALIVGLGADGTVRSWRTTDLQETRSFEMLGDHNSSFAFSESGTLLAVGTRTGEARVINRLTGMEIGRFSAGSGMMKVLGFATEENQLLTHDRDGVVSQWDLLSGQRKHQWQIPEPYQDITLAQTKDLLATLAGGRLAVRRATDGQQLWNGWEGANPPRFSHDAMVLAVPDPAGFTKLFDARTGAETAMLGGSLLGNHSVAFSSDDQRLAIGSDGIEAVKVWDTGLRQELLTLEGQGSLFSRTAFSPDGRFLASSGMKGLHLWHAPSWEAIAAAEAKENEANK
jgi:WD40 repeat protein/tRNA A-37 threonylcarbamoyl transferase component Bud32